ncbi:MAG: beta-ketoacyl synthase N-terminal-like domain-containing protein [Pseudomonadota bacterium]
MNKPASRSLSDLSPAQLKLLVVELQRKLAAANAAPKATQDPIAVIGLAGRYPGADETLDSFWDLMVERRSAIQSADTGEGPRLMNSGTDDRTVYGGYLDNLDRFDAEAFGVPDAEARQMDPQQRLLLEVCWEAMERAGLAGDRLMSNTGVFLGICTSDFADVLTKTGQSQPGHFALGNSHGLMAGRVSRALGLTGPSAAYNSACASSLVAAYEACRALQRGDCDVALVCGVNTVVTDLINRDLAALNVISRTGRCRPFDAHADGYVRGEGCGAIVLRRRVDAVKAGDTISAEIRGLGMTHDGTGQQMTPSRSAQARAMRLALEDAGVAPGEVGYIEAGSIGAALADAVEGAAMAEVFGQGRKTPLRIGTVKPLIGHLEGASGIAALTRTILSLSKDTWLPHGGLDQINPHMDWCDGALRIDTAPVAAEKAAPYASVNSSSLSGTNVHFVLAPAEPGPPAEPRSPGPVPLLLSARSADGLAALASEISDWIAAHPCGLQDLATTFATARSPLAVRAACVIKDPEHAARALAALVARPAPTEPMRLAWDFGQTQIPPPQDRKAVAAEAAALAVWADLGAEMSPAARHLARAMSASVQLGQLGLRPAATTGDPLAAAHAAGLLSPQAAMQVLYAKETGQAVPDVAIGRATCPIYCPAQTGALPVAHLTPGRLMALEAGGAADLPSDLVRLGIAQPAPLGVADAAAGGWPQTVAALFSAGLPLRGAAVAAMIGGRVTHAPVAGFSRKSFWPDLGMDSPSPTPHIPDPGPVKSGDEARAILDAILRDELSIDAFDGQTDLSQIGASSLEVMRAMARIEEQLAFRPDIDSFINDPTLDGLLNQYMDSTTAPAKTREPDYEEGWI